MKIEQFSKTNKFAKILPTITQNMKRLFLERNVSGRISLKNMYKGEFELVRGCVIFLRLFRNILNCERRLWLADFGCQIGFIFKTLTTCKASF